MVHIQPYIQIISSGQRVFIHLTDMDFGNSGISRLVMSMVITRPATFLRDTKAI